MHENRETPWPTVSESRSPAGEGESRTSGMHSSGESDGAVVPMKPSNKATGQAPEAAERVEGRASTKENVQQARAVPAQHGAAASQGLKGVRKVAQERKQERFTTLLHHLTVNLLRDSYYALKREAAPGVDGVRWAEYEDGLEPRLKDLHERVHRGSYRAQASRRIYMQKPDGRQRPIGIAVLEDKIVQQAVVTILNAIYEEDFRGFQLRIPAGTEPAQRVGRVVGGNRAEESELDFGSRHSILFRQTPAQLAGPVCGTSGGRQTSSPPDPEMVEGGRGGRRTVVPDRGRESARFGDFADFSQSLPAPRSGS